MKVHFIGDLTGDQVQYQKIIYRISDLGFTVITDHCATRKYQDLKYETQAETELYLQRMLSWIREADIVVVESTILGFGTGYETGLALQQGKTVIMLYKPNKDNTPFVIKGQNNDRMQLLAYNDETLDEILRMALDFAKEQADIRFTMIITPRIAKHLKTVAEKGTNRSEYIRQLIEKDMEGKV